MKFSITPHVNVSIIDNGKILLSRRKDTGWMDGLLCIPGGHIEKGETPRQAAQRELKEELDLDIKIDDLEFLCVAARNKQPVQYVGYQFALRGGNLKYINAEPDKCSELVWVDIDKLPTDVIHISRDIIEQGLVGGKKYLEASY
jgi:8-oxo-dGTP diphosphatase